jgi:hypothetical protein
MDRRLPAAPCRPVLFLAGRPPLPAASRPPVRGRRFRQRELSACEPPFDDVDRSRRSWAIPERPTSTVKLPSAWRDGESRRAADLRALAEPKHDWNGTKTRLEILKSFGFKRMSRIGNRVAEFAAFAPRRFTQATGCVVRAERGTSERHATSDLRTDLRAGASVAARPTSKASLMPTRVARERLTRITPPSRLPSPRSAPRPP